MKFLLAFLLDLLLVPIVVVARLSKNSLVHRQLQQTLPGNCENFVTSGYGITDPESIRFYKDQTFLSFLQAGSYSGRDDIFEYLRFAGSGSPYIFSSEIQLQVNQFAGYSPDPKLEESKNLCQFDIAILTHEIRAAHFSSEDNIIHEFLSMVKIFWDPVEKFVDHIYLYYGADQLISSLRSIDTPNTAEFVCKGLIFGACESFLPKEGNPKTLDECITQFAALPLAEGDLFHIDGNSRGCRYIHSGLAASGLPGAAQTHCPHVSFAAMEDPQGSVMCESSADLGSIDLFTDSDLLFYQESLLTLGFKEDTSTHFVGNTDTSMICPRGFYLSNLNSESCEALCDGDLELGINPDISGTVPVCVGKSNKSTKSDKATKVRKSKKKESKSSSSFTKRAK